MSGFARLAQTSEDQNIVLWINEYFGRIEREGRQLHEMPVYLENAGRVLGSVVIPRRNQDTFGRDMEDVITRKLTLNLGVRYDFDTPRTERYNRLSWFDPSLISPLAAKVPSGAGHVGRREESRNVDP